MLARRCLLAALPAALLALPTAAAAQSRGPYEIFVYQRATDRMAFDVQTFEPSTSPQSITTLDTAGVAGHLSFTAGLWSSYAARPWIVENVVNGAVVPGSARDVVGSLWQSELHLSLGLFEYFELGLALPLVVNTHAPLGSNDELDFDQSVQSVRAGDLRGYVKIPILRGEWPVALRVGATVPLGGQDAFAGNIAWTLTPALVASHQFGPLTAALNVGYRFRERNGLSGYDAFVLDDELLWGVGARYDLSGVLHQRVGINAELYGRVGVSTGALAANRNPVEVDAAAFWRPTESLEIQLGGGRGLTGGYGSPDWRAFVGARFTATRTSCTTGPEDFDGYQDGDFCRDPDNDADGVPDADDRCPNDPEDLDRYADADGCPDVDNDADGVGDDDDRCPLEPEDHDGFEDTDGCPEPDNDRDTVPDRADACPMDPEDADNYQDEDGCPEPGPEAVVVTRTESHLLLSQRIFFDYDSDTIRSVSLPILNAVAQVLHDNPDITRVRVEGYTDARGDAQYNLDLSYRRARAVVEYLASQGIPREHLEFQGYGSGRPVADDSTPEGQALNRRVEFTILRQRAPQHEQPQPQQPAPGPQTPRPRHHHHHGH